MPGSRTSQWDGRGNNGTKWPDGNYTLSITAKDASGQSVAVSTKVRGTVDSVDLTQNPPTLSIGGQNFTLDKIKQRACRAGAVALAVRRLALHLRPRRFAARALH